MESNEVNYNMPLSELYYEDESGKRLTLADVIHGMEIMIKNLNLRVTSLEETVNKLYLESKQKR